MIAVIGCGNANRRDDAAGLDVVRQLYGRDEVRSRADVRLLDAGTDGMLVMFAARGCERLIIVDSSRTGAEAGAVFEIPGSELETQHESSLNLHDFRWDNALHAGRQIYREAFPADVTVYLIEARDFEFGIGLSPEISKATRAVADRIAARIDALPPGTAIASETDAYRE
jgi:hydrogenase maturation protease